MAPSFWSRQLRNSNWARRLLSAFHPRVTTFRKRGRTSLPLWLEVLEDRTAPAVLPTPVITNPANTPLPFTFPTNAPASYPLIDGQVLVDPSNPQHLVAAASYDPVAGVINNTTIVAGLRIWYSTDAEATWSNPLTVNNLKDPTDFSAPQVNFAENEHAVLAFDKLDNFYVVSSQHNVANTSGALTLVKYNFSGTTPFSVSLDGNNNGQYVLYRWDGTDPAYNPVVAIDTNTASFTDPTTGTVQKDSMANGLPDANGTLQPKAIYVAWNTYFTLPNPNINNPANISRVVVSASDDGGRDFSTTEYASGPGGIGDAGAPAAAPQIAFTQGSASGSVAGGHLLFFWSGSTAGNGGVGSGSTALFNQIVADSSSPDGGVATAPAVGAQVFTGAGGTIADATVPANTPPNNIPTSTQFLANVNITDPNFTTLDDLTVTLNVRATNLAELGITLTSPGGQTITLVRNQLSPVNSQAIGNPPSQGITGANLGVVIGGPNNSQTHDIGTVFDDQAPRSISSAASGDTTVAAPYVGHYRPEIPGSLSAFNGLTAAQLDGPWTLTITDNVNDGSNPPIQFVDNWSLDFTSGISTSGFGPDAALPTTYTDANNNAATTVTGSYTNVYPLTGVAFGTPGVGPGIHVAVDNTLGSFSPYAGSIYVVYTGFASHANASTNNTDVFLMRSTNGGLSWTSSQVNNDSTADNFSEGNRPQFMPDAAVDPITGTLVITWYDGRYDPSMDRVANFVTDSIDGGADFSPQTFLSQPKQAIDAITGDTVTIEPVPGNQPQAGTLGFGDDQGLSVYDGQIYAGFSSNLNAAGASIFVADATFAAGPRILSGDMGPITAAFSTDGATYNNSFAPDGTRELTGFAVTFDRPILISTFPASQVTVYYRDTVTSPSASGVLIPQADYTVVPLDAGSQFGLLPANSAVTRLLATTFLIEFNTPQSGVGTYSYAIGNLTGAAVITDGLRNHVDENQNAVAGETPNSTVSAATVVANGAHGDGSGDGYKVGNVLTVQGGTFTTAAQLTVTSVDPFGFGEITGVSVSRAGVYTAAPTNPAAVSGGNGSGATFALTLTGSVGDVFAVPAPTDGPPFQLPYSSTTLPLIIPGPHVASTDVSFNPSSSGTADNLVLNGTNNAIDVTFDRDIQPGSFTTGNILRMTSPVGPITTYSQTTAAPIPVATPATKTLSLAPGVLTSTLKVTDSLMVTDLTVQVSLTDPNLADLSATLIAPDGTQVPLFATGDLTGANLTSTVFDDFAASAVTGAAAPYTGTFRPSAGALKVLNGKNYLGTWQLVLSNSDTGNTGTLNGWSLNPFSVTQLNSRTFRVTFPTQTVSGTYTIQFGPDAQGNYIKDTALNSATVASGGTKYSKGDVLTVQGGTFTTAAQFMVAGVGPTGAVTAVELVQPGFYTADPTSPVSVTGGTGTGATLALVFGNQVDSNFNAGVNLLRGGDPNNGTILPNVYSSGLSMQGPGTVVSGGALYSVGDVLTLQGGTFTAPATLLVTSVDPTTGAVTGVQLAQAGSYTVAPTSPVGVTGGTGTGATFAPLFGTTPLPPRATVSSTITVPDSFLVQNVTLQLTILHQNDPDLTAVLIAPDGKTVQLFSGVGTSGSSPHANFTNTTFSDAATIPIQLAVTQPGTGIGAGPFDPQFPLSKFKGLDSQGGWTLEIISNSSTLSGTLVNWTLTLNSSVPGSGLGEPVADQFPASFRIFVQDPTNALSQTEWTAVGPASINSGGGSGRIGGLAVDPSDPSGNTVYAAGASGGVWKTTDFLTASGNGPTWVPLTTVGPANAVDTGSIAVFGRNHDPNQSIIFVATGEGDTSSPGVGFLRSMDGGRTWRLLDSTDNVDASGNVLPINDPGRDHIFVNANAFRILVDPTLAPNGQVIVYAAMSSGVWRSTDTGGHWTLLQAGFASDIALSASSAGGTGNLQILYAAIEQRGVYYTTNAPTALSMSIRNGGTGVNLRRDFDVTPDAPIPVGNTAVNPSGANGRITLAVPSLTGDPLQDTLYEGWLYAMVATPAGAFQGLYLTKDFGLNWTKVRIPVVTINGVQYPTNDDSIATDYGVIGDKNFAQGNYNQTLAVDPNNPSVVYLGGTSDGNPYGFIRVDTATTSDAYALVPYDNSNNDGGQIQYAPTTGGITVKAAGGNGALGALGPGKSYGLTSNPNVSYYNLERDPNAPFVTPSSLQFGNVASFTNTGEDGSWMPFTGGGLGGTDQHELVVMRDPLTGATRLIFGDDQGIWTGLDDGSGNAIAGIGSAASVLGSRNGNIQITQFYYGAAQPSTLAADLAGALLYGNAQDDGFPRSDPHVLDDGNLNWTGSGGDGGGVATDQTGSGSSYSYAWPCCGATPTAADFFLYTNPNIGTVSRTTGLLQAGDDPANQKGQWPYLGVINFAVNPIDPTAIAMSSSAGRVFFSSGPSIGTGIQWFPIADPTDLDGTYAPAIAFGAPADANAPLSDFIYVGTSGGHIYVSFTGGGVGVPWANISAGLDGSPVEQIVTNPARGSHEAYAVTQDGVYWMADSSAPGATWVSVTGNLFSNAMTRVLFNDPAQSLSTLRYLDTIQADWRYAIPDDLTKPNGPKHPVLYVAGDGGVYRSLDKGKTWTYFPNIATDGAEQQGGFLPTTVVSALSLSLGNINPLNGTPNQVYGRNMLVATTYGNGTFAIRLNDQIQLANGATLASYAISAVAGPHVVSITATNTTTPLRGITVTFSGPVDPASFTAVDINSVTDPAGNPIAVSNIVDLTGGNPHNVYEIVFATPQTKLGFYNVSLGPNISDYSGDRMDQNQNGINGEVPGDVYSGRFLFQPGANRAPVLHAATAAFPPILENANPNGGSDLPTFLGTTLITDGNDAQYAPGVAPRGIAITGVDDTNGIWQYSTDGGTTWNTITGVTNTTALLLEDANRNRLRFLPNVNYSSLIPPSPTFTFRAWDLTSGLTLTGGDGGMANTSVNGGTTAFSATTATAVLTVTFVNQPPSFTKGPDQTGFENSGPVTVSNWATNILPYPAPPAPPKLDQSGETVSFVVTTNNPGLFAAGPAIDSSGTLTYTPATNVSGTAVVTVVAQNSGGTANGGNDTSAPQTFNLTVTFVNLPPSFTEGPDQTVPENAGPQTVANWATNILPYPAPPAPPKLDQAGETVSFVVTTNNPGLFAAGPAIDSSGTLTYTPVTNASGTAVVTVVAQNSGGTANGGNDTSAPQTFNLTVTFVNQPPSFTEGPDQTVLENSGPQTVANWATNILPYPAPPAPPKLDQAGETVSFVVTTNNPGLFAAGPAIDSSGTLTYTPVTNASGTAVVTVVAQNSGGTANGGNDTSAPQTFNLTVTFVNQPPSFTKGPDQTVLENSGPQTVANWATNVSAGPNPAGETVSFVVTTNNPGLFAAGPAIDSSGTLTYTPATNASGAAVVTVVAKNSGGTANGGNDTSAPQTFNLTVTFVNQPPSFTKGPDQTILVDSGPQTVNNWATSVSAGPNPAGETVSFIVTTNNPGLFAAGPALSPTGTLTYTPAANTTGTAVVTVVAQNSGGTANGGNDTSAPQTFNLSVVRITPSVTVGSSAGASSAFGQPVTFTATIGGAANGLTPTQTVTFTDTTTGTVLASNVPVSTANGATTAVLRNVASLGVGSHTIAAAYSGDANFLPGQGTFALTVNKAGTTTTIAPATAASVYGQSLSFTVTVAVVAPGAGTPTQPVTLYDGDPTKGGTAVGSGALAAVNGVFTATVSVSGTALSAATTPHSLFAVYGGDANFATSTTAAPAKVTVHQAATKTTIGPTPVTAAYGTPETFTATVANTGLGTATPTGTVTFWDGVVNTGRKLGSGALVNGQATLTVSATGALGGLNVAALNVGGHGITVSYTPTPNFLGSSTVTAASLTVTRAVTHTAVSASTATPVYGQPVTLTATVATTGGGGTLTGTVSFYDGTVSTSTKLGAGTLRVVNGTTIATFVTTAPLSIALHTIVGVYSGDANGAASSSLTTGASAGVTVSKADTVPTVTSSVPAGALTGQAVTFTATVSARAPGSGTPTGTVTFTIDGVSHPVTLVGGKASLTTSFATAGNHNVIASYGGDAHFNVSSNAAAPFTQVVNVPVLARLLVALVGNVLEVTALDALGRLLTSYNGQQPLSIVQMSGPGVVSGLPAAPTSLWVNGVAMIPIHVATRGTYTLHVSSGSVVLVPDFTFNVVSHIG